MKPTETRMAFLWALYKALKSLPIPTLSESGRVIHGQARHEQRSLLFLPNEILLEIFSFMELKPYIICHGVCKKWQRLLPSTQLHPIRKRLLDLYRRILDTRDFEKTLEWTNQHLQPFDREEYVRCLLTQYPVIPEEFRMWIHEWPSRLVVQCIWPGLPFINCRTISRVVRRTGLNWIAYRSSAPQLLSLVYKERTPAQTFIPGLYIWCWATESDWLIFEQGEPDLFGRVFLIDGYNHNTGSIPYYPHRESADGDTDDDEDADSEYSEGEGLITFADWISYLDFLWNRTANEILHPTKVYLDPDLPIHRPINYISEASGGPLLPALAWNSPQRNLNY